MRPRYSHLSAAELNSAENQPELGGKGPKGLPLDQFVDEAYQGLAEGKDQVPVGTAKGGFVEGGFELQRQAATQKIIAGMKQMLSKSD